MYKRPPADLIAKHVQLRCNQNPAGRTLFTSLLVCLGGLSYGEASVVAGFQRGGSARDAISRVSASPSLRQLHSEISVDIMNSWHIEQRVVEAEDYIADAGGESRMIDLVRLGGLVVRWSRGEISEAELRGFADASMGAAIRHGRSRAARLLIESGGCGPALSSATAPAPLSGQA